MPTGKAILALEEEGAAELQAHPHQLGTPHQHGVEGCNGLIQQRVPLVFGKAGLLRRAERRQAVLEHRVGMHRLLPHARAQDRERLIELARP